MVKLKWLQLITGEDIGRQGFSFPDGRQLWVESRGQEIKRMGGERRQDRRSPLDGMDQEHMAKRNVC